MLPDAFLSFAKPLFIHWFDLIYKCNDYFKLSATEQSPFQTFQGTLLPEYLSQTQRPTVCNLHHLCIKCVHRQAKSKSFDRVDGDICSLNHLKVIQGISRLCTCMLCRYKGLPMLRPLTF